MANIHDRPTLAQSGLRFDKFGYFTRPLETLSASAPDSQRWCRFEDIVAQAKLGDFSRVGQLLEDARATSDWDLKTPLVKTLGYTAPSEVFREMRREIESDQLRNADAHDVPARETIRDYCHAFCLWARLDVVPVLLDQYITLKQKDARELGSWPLMMARLLTDESGTMIAHEPPADMLEDYLNLVMNTYDSVADRLGSDKVHVFEGELLSARSLAEKMRSATGRWVTGTLKRLRERFEPMTGIDCSEIFMTDDSKMLVAATIAEDFLNSDQVDAYEDGVRYFFGHRVPD